MKENSTDQNASYFCFDIQPKLPESEYSCTEDQTKRGANDIRSALLDYLRKYEFPKDCTSIRFFRRAK